MEGNGFDDIGKEEAKLAIVEEVGFILIWSGKSVE